MSLINLSNWLYDNENPPHFIQGIKTITYDVTTVNVFLTKKIIESTKKDEPVPPILLIFELFFCKKIPLSRRVGYVMDWSVGE